MAIDGPVLIDHQVVHFKGGQRRIGERVSSKERDAQHENGDPKNVELGVIVPLVDYRYSPLYLSKMLFKNG